MSVQDIVKRGSIYIPPDNRKLFIKRVQLNGEYETDWFEITEYVQQWGVLTVGFPDDVYIGEYEESDIDFLMNNNRRRFNAEDDSNSFFYNFKTRYKTRFKVEVYAVDNDEDVLLRAWYGIFLGNPVTNDSGDMSFNVSPITKIFQFYKATGIDVSSADSETLITRLVEKDSLFDKYFEGFVINPDSLSTMTIAEPYIKEDDTILDKIRDYSAYNDFFYYVNDDGEFVWDSRVETSAIVWEFNGAGQTDSTFGTNIQSIDEAYNDIDNTYTRVVIKYRLNEIIERTFLDGLRRDDDTTNYLSEANSISIYNKLVTDGYIGTGSRLTQLYTTSPIDWATYDTGTWSTYAEGIQDKLDKTLRADEKEAVASQTWSVGDGSASDIYGERLYVQEYQELSKDEAQTVADMYLENYRINYMVWKAKVYGVMQLSPKDKIKINYLGEINVVNPIILGVSELGGNDVLGGRTGSIRIRDGIAKVESVSINLDNFDINMKWREII
jgi:hypothetical protein